MEFAAALLELAAHFAQADPHILVTQAGVEGIVRSAQARDILALRLGHAIDKIIYTLLTASHRVRHANKSGMLHESVQRVARA